MAGKKDNGREQNPCEASNSGLKQLADFIAKGMLENAVHMMQDARSPSHGPWFPWDGGRTILCVAKMISAPKNTAGRW
jgi:hypothetical protein